MERGGLGVGGGTLPEIRETGQLCVACISAGSLQLSIHIKENLTAAETREERSNHMLTNVAILSVVVVCITSLSLLRLLFHLPSDNNAQRESVKSKKTTEEQKIKKITENNKKHETLIILYPITKNPHFYCCSCYIATVVVFQGFRQFFFVVRGVIRSKERTFGNKPPYPCSVFPCF